MHDGGLRGAAGNPRRFAGNDFLALLLDLADQPEVQPLSIGIQQFNVRAASRPPFIRASAVLSMIVPVFMFLITLRAFMRGVVVTGVDK